MIVKKELSMGIGAILAAVALALPGAAIAQADEDAVVANETVEEIVVTGSRLVRRDYTAPSPITTIDR